MLGKSTKIWHIEVIFFNVEEDFPIFEYEMRDQNEALQDIRMRNQPFWHSLIYCAVSLLDPGRDPIDISHQRRRTHRLTETTRERSSRRNSNSTNSHTQTPRTRNSPPAAGTRPAAGWGLLSQLTTLWSLQPTEEGEKTKNNINKQRRTRWNKTNHSLTLRDGNQENLKSFWFSSR